jgi:hypothetical protein
MSILFAKSASPPLYQTARVTSSYFGNAGSVNASHRTSSDENHQKIGASFRGYTEEMERLTRRLTLSNDELGKLPIKFLALTKMLEKKEDKWSLNLSQQTLLASLLVEALEKGRQGDSRIAPSHGLANQGFQAMRGHVNALTPKLATTLTDQADLMLRQLADLPPAYPNVELLQNSAKHIVNALNTFTERLSDTLFKS